MNHSDDTDGEWLDKLLAVATDTDAILRCPGGPGEDCDNRSYLLAPTGTPGPSETLAVVCAECGLRIATVNPSKMVPGIESQLAEVKG